MNKTSILKADFDIVYKNALRRNDTSVMDLYCFFDAIELLANKAFKLNFRENLENLLNIAIDYFEK